jgi:CRISPR system Cascade subunit CasE
MTSLWLARIAVDRRALQAFAIARGLSDDDLGHALHVALRQRYGAAAPQPWRLFADGPATPHLLGYCADREALTDAAALPHADQLIAAVFPSAPDARPMPSAWRTGARYRFDVRVRPTVRFGTAARAARAGRTAPGGAAAEVDAWTVAMQSKTGHQPTREATYTSWLRTRLENGAEIETVTLAAMRRLETRRPDHLTGGGGNGKTVKVELPEAVFHGTLAIADAGAFARRVADGVGRHRAFGFGMLLLAPAQ